MKKGIIIVVSILCVIGLATAGIFVVASKGLLSHHEAKGLILYGTDEQLQADLETEEASTTYSYETKVKIVDEQLLVIREKDMKEFCEKQIVNQVDANDQCTPVANIESAEDKPVYYAKDAKENVTIDGKTLEVTAAEDYIIGNGRIFQNGYLVVSDSQYDEIQAEETGMLVLNLNKAADKEIGQCQFNQVQLIDIP
ncbi:MAG: lipoprotein BA_5634 family protein [Hespellia sp.]|nr:lipoprotein BA_5634 family protein [Hespellia sp.]